MSAKQAIKQIVPRPLWAKLQSVKETHNGKKAEKTQSQRFMRWISLEKQIRHIPQIRYITRVWQHCMNISNVMKNKVMILLKSKPCSLNPFGRLRKSIRSMIQRLMLARL